MRPTYFSDEYATVFAAYANDTLTRPLLLHGDAVQVLGSLPSDSIDCAMTSPPYWGKRQYSGGGIGMEADYREFLKALADVAFEIKRVLKPKGSFWLNI